MTVMANPDRGEFILDLGGEVRLLRLNFGSVRVIERILGPPKDWKPEELIDHQAWIVFGCLNNHPEYKQDRSKLTSDLIDEWMADLDWRETGKTLREAIDNFLKEPDPETETDLGNS